MASGVRLHHVTHRNKTMVIDNYERLIKTEDGQLKPKRYPVKLDDLGNCIVSETVWQRLQQAGYGHEFLVMNEVKQPPDQKLELILPPRATVHAL